MEKENLKLNDISQLAFLFDDDGNAIITNEEILGYNADDYDDAPVPLWLWSDPVIFDDDAKEEVLKIDARDFEGQNRFIQERLNKFYAENSQYAKFINSDIYENPTLLLDLFESLTLEDFRAVNLRNAEVRFNQLQQLIDACYKRLARNRKRVLTGLALYMPILSIRDLVTESELAALYYQKHPRISSRELARQMGAIGKVGGRQAIISNSKYGGAFDLKPNRWAYLSFVGAGYWQNVETDAFGNLYEKDEAEILRKVQADSKGKKRKMTGAKLPDEELPPGIDKDLVGTLFAAVLKTSVYDGNEFAIYVPDFSREMNKNYRNDLDQYDEKGEPKNDEPAADVFVKPSIMKNLRSLDEWVGVLHNSEVRRVLVIAGINKEANIIYVTSPYLTALLRAMEDEQNRAVREKKQLYEKPNFNKLIHTTMASERNKPAVALVVRISNGLLQRGSKTTSKFKENKGAEPGAESERVNYSVSFETLIKDVPELSAKLNSQEMTTSNKNTVLKRAFEKAYKLMKSKTDLYKYFVDLNVPEMIPTTTTLDTKLVITHAGRNADYKAKI